MSAVTIEGIRQAFIDHESRIRFGDDRPDDLFTYPRIRSLNVRRAAFLGDHEISFSPNMNALIGGGGTGKSTIIEYLRLVLGQGDSIEGAEARNNYEKLRRTVRADTLIDVQVERDGATWVLRNDGNRSGTIVEGEPVPDFAKFFPVRFFSQREIYAIAESREARGELLDNLVRDRLEELRRAESDIVASLRQLNLQIAGRSEIEKRLQELKTEELDARKKLESLNALAGPLAEWRATLDAQRELDELQEAVTEARLAVQEAVGSTRSNPCPKKTR
jgi:DNA repair ATPase RecN